MDTVSAIEVDPTRGAASNPLPRAQKHVHVGLLTACQDKPYVFGFATSMAGKPVSLDVIGSDEVDGPEMHCTPNISFINLRASQRESIGPTQRVSRLLVYYSRLIGYAARTKAQIFHILWNNRFEYLDRTLLMSYYRMLGKQVVLTAHNVNQARRDNKDSLLNRWTLRFQYALANHVFVHTEKAKSELRGDFRVHESKITVIPFGINNAVPRTDLTSAEAKHQLGIDPGEKAILYFGRIRPYKGIEHLLAAYEILVAQGANYRLIVAGEPKKGSEEYRDEIQRMIAKIGGGNRIVSRFQFIPDADIERYLKAADVLVLPYKEIFQSGVLFLAYSFGLPVVAADVGSFRDEVVEGRNGFLCDPGNATDLSNAIERYFDSQLYRDLNDRRQDIREYAQARHSWEVVAGKTLSVYEQLTQKHSS